MKYIKLLSLLITLLIFTNDDAFSWQECDSIRSCLGRALTLTVNEGKGAHYVDIVKTSSWNKFDKELTFQAWINPEKQEGKTVFLAGLWGPAYDKNDVWRIYFTPDDRLIFEVNGPETDMRYADNTFAEFEAAGLYDKWSHISAVFDGYTEQVYLYIDGIVVDSSRNASYPADRLRKQTNPELPVQLGSTSSLSDNPDNRTFRGQIDEVKIWARSLPPDEILCQKDKAHYGTEDSLMVYYRMNETPVVYNLCDATGHGNFGKARSGASCQYSDRKFITTVIGSPLKITDTLKCDTEKSWTFTVVDTGVCQNRIWMRVLDERKSEYTITPSNTYLEPGIPTQFTLTLNTEYVGNIKSRLQIIPYNWCRQVITVPLDLTRITELQYDKDTVEFGELLAHCTEKPWVDSTIRICNRSDLLGTPEDITINSITSQMPDVFRPIHGALPVTLKPGDCYEFDVRFISGDTTALYLDTLMINSTDKCVGSGKIPLSGSVMDVLAITGKDGSTRMDSIDFGTVCVDYASNAVNWLWTNLSDEDIFIDSIIVPGHFIVKKFKYPVMLEPATGYKDNYFRFTPEAPGVFMDSIVFVVRAGGCTIMKPVYVQGRGFFADVRFTVDSADFGDVIIGQELSQNISVKNHSDDTLTLAFYLRTGESFFLTGTRQFSLTPGQTKSLPVTFRPVDEEIYYDEICLFEQRCYTSACINIKGRGVLERFDFEPLVMRTDNVLACSNMDDTLNIINRSGVTQELSDFVLNDPSGRFSFVDPPTPPSSVMLSPGESQRFIFNYDPNDLTTDRADRAFLDYRTSDGVEWSAKLFGTSIVPKIFVTDQTLYGILEVGDSKRDTITIENSSPLDIQIDSIYVPNGFTLIWPGTNPNIVLGPRDSIQAIIDFTPAVPGEYSDTIEVFSTSPCLVRGTGILAGTAVIVPLEAPLSVISFGFVRPCDCETRTVPLVNGSKVFDMSIDSIWIDDNNIPVANPEFFSWTSFYSPDGTTPYSIPPWSRDTVKITYCPRTTSERQKVDNAARLNILASGSGWEGDYDVFLAGKSQLMFEPLPVEHTFPPTRVDTFSVPGYIKLKIPGLDMNPDQSDIKIDSITFVPNERVFFASDSLGNPFPLSLISPDSLMIQVDFKPRAVRAYSAKMKIHASRPCSFSDTTVLLNGVGFAPAFGLDFVFENDRVPLDTFRFINCDTLTIPVYSSRNFPAEVVDIKCRIGYDTTKLMYISSQSDYLDESCGVHVPNISHTISQYGGSEFLLKNFCNVDSLRPIVTAKYIALQPDRDTLRITVDSIYFDTEEVILYHIIAETDSGRVIILEPDFEILSPVVFDSTMVLDCQSRIAQILNTGDVPLSVDNILELPPDVKVISSVPPPVSMFNPGEIAEITLEFCPRRKQEFDTLYLAESINPCFMANSNTIRGIGYAPEFPFVNDVAFNFTVPDTLSTQIGDTIAIPLVFEKDFSAVRHGIEYWLNGLSFTLDMAYNPRALKYLDIQNNTGGDMEVDYSHGFLKLNFSGVDTLKAGPAAEARFLAAVPDSVISFIYTESYGFETDSIFFLDLIPSGSDAFFLSGEKCNINSLQFPDEIVEGIRHYPQPWNDMLRITFRLSEKSELSLRILNSQGVEVLEPIAPETKESGIYNINIPSRNLSSGLYYYVLKAGGEIKTGKIVLLK